jgi:hypothetical protein
MGSFEIGNNFLDISVSLFFSGSEREPGRSSG